MLSNEFCLSTVAPLINENIENNIRDKISANKDDYKKWVCTGIASLLYFVQNNWTGPFKNEDIEHLLPLRKIALTKLSFDDQCNENVVKHEFLYLAKVILCNKQIQEIFPSSIWWLLRINYIHQSILEESSAALFDDSENLIQQISELDLLKDAALETVFNVEVANFYLSYLRIQSSEKYLENASTTAQLTLELEGALGKRTKYQQQEKAQLYLKAKVDKVLFPHRTCESLPKVINLSDDLRLEKIEFTEKTETVVLGSTEEAIVMAKL